MEFFYEPYRGAPKAADAAKPAEKDPHLGCRRESKRKQDLKDLKSLDPSKLHRVDLLKQEDIDEESRRKQRVADYQKRIYTEASKKQLSTQSTMASKQS